MVAVVNGANPPVLRMYLDLHIPALKKTADT